MFYTPAMSARVVSVLLGVACAFAASRPGVGALASQAAPVLRQAVIDGSGPGWRALGPGDFAAVNGTASTWTWSADVLVGSGEPIGVMRTREELTNFELVIEWRHLTSGGNSGVFVWVPPHALAALKPGELPQYGIEVQMLDQGYTALYEARTMRPADWFTTHGDVFAVGQSKLVPFAPASPNGARSFPRKQLSRPSPEWNHYYVRAINGELRLWVNGEEVSGGANADPRTGYLCVEAEGAPIEFRNFRIRDLP